MIYTRKVLSGECTVFNRLLVANLSKLGLWTDEMMNKIIASGGKRMHQAYSVFASFLTTSLRGSIQSIEEIPLDIRMLFKTVWDIAPYTTLKMSAGRGPFVCQSQSLSIYLEKPSLVDVVSTTCLIYGIES